MPILKKAMRPYQFSAGTKSATGRCHPDDGLFEAITNAFANYKNEHGEEVKLDERCFITVSFSTCLILAEVTVRPED